MRYTIYQISYITYMIDLIYIYPYMIAVGIGKNARRED